MYLLVWFILLMGSMGASWGQGVITNLLTLTAPPPPSVTSLSTTIVGNRGNATYYYWVVANYPGGKSAVSPSAIVISAPNTLSGGNYVRVNWNSQAGASSYDLLRTTTATVPNGNCACAVTTALAATTYNDIGGALGAYTVTSQGGAITNCSIDNITVATPTVVCSPYAFSGPAGGALAGTYPNPTIANLPVVGGIPIVTSAGNLGQDATALFWDATNDRLTSGVMRIGTGFAGLAEVSNSGVFNTSSYALGSDATSSTYLNAGANIYFRIGNAQKMNLTANGNLLIGPGTADGNYKLDIQASGSIGTFRAFDQGGAGSTFAVIQAGAAQSGPLFSIRTNAGVETLYATSAGELGQKQATVDKWYLNYPNFDFASGGTFRWSSTTDAFGTVDLGIARNAAGIVEVNNGTAGTLRDLLSRQYKNTPVAVASLQTCNAGNAGSTASVNNALGPVLGAAVVGGGAVVAQVFCTGTTWDVSAF